MQGLGSTQHRRKSLDRYTHDIIFGLLGSERNSCRLCMEAQKPRARILGFERFPHLARPDTSGGAVLGNLFKEIVVCVEEEGQARREAVYVHAAGDAPTHILQPVAE